MRSQPVTKGDLLRTYDGLTWQVYNTKRRSHLICRLTPATNPVTMMAVDWDDVEQINRGSYIPGECKSCGSVWSDNYFPFFQQVLEVITLGSYKPKPQPFCLDCGQLKD